MKLIVALGNPGREYVNTRHNAGWIVLDHMLGKNLHWAESSNAKALYYTDSVSQNKVEYIKPQTMMNRSGFSVGYAKRKHKIPPEDIIVIHDDIDLPLGVIRISQGKSSGGHNGVESVISILKSKNFIRVRIGVCPVTSTGRLRKPKGEDKVVRFLLSNFKKEELAIVKKLSKKVSEAVEMIYAEGLPKAMSLFNN